MARINQMLVLTLVGLAAAACDDTPTEVAPFSGFEASNTVLQNRSLSQVDRMGIPAVNTAFVASPMDKDLFNLGTPATDEAQFFSVLTETIMARYGLDAGAAQGLADFVLPDALPIGDLSGFPNGRRPADDVIDADLGLIFGVFGPAVPPLQSDNVDENDVPFSNTFPYFAAPQTS